LKVNNKCCFPAFNLNANVILSAFTLFRNLSMLYVLAFKTKACCIDVVHLFSEVGH